MNWTEADWRLFILICIYGAIAVGVIVLIIVHDRSMDKVMEDFVDDIEITLASYDEGTEIMTVTYKSGRVTEFKGSGTVWYSYPMMERCHTRFEARLVDIKRYITEHGNPYPIAHEVA